MAVRAKFMCNMWRIVSVERRVAMEGDVGGGGKKGNASRRGSHGTHAA